MIGLMSGTSLDGLDICDVVFKPIEGNWVFDICHAETITYPIELKQSLKIAFFWSEEEVERLDRIYSEYLCDEVLKFIDTHQIKEIDAVSSHGHTIWHQPDRGFTKQIGNQFFVAQRTGLTWVCDFRVADIALGGQGAPLVPIGDQLLFTEYDYCLNLGGFANLSFSLSNDRVAYDICAVNVVLNRLAQSLNMDYDKDGSTARGGHYDKDLLFELNAMAYYQKPYPKSLGIEWVENILWPIIERYKIPIADKMATYVDHVAQQIGTALVGNRGDILVTGGGAKHQFLMDRIAFHAKQNLTIPELQIVDFKEAIIFAFLGVLRLRNEFNCLKNVTGASNDHSSGNIFLKP